MSLESARAVSTSKVDEGLRVQDGPRRITKWLDLNYKKKMTKETYYTTLRLWVLYFDGPDSIGKYIGFKWGIEKEIVKRDVEKRINEIEKGVEKYFSQLDGRVFLNDYKGFIHWLEKERYASLSIRGMCFRVKLFFGRQDERCRITDEDWAQIKRALLPKSTSASTQDKILTKEELKTVLQHDFVHGRALALFLCSTGVRVGAACQLKMGDIHLDEDPPRVNIRPEYTKGDVGGRVMWFSYEARDAIREWHKAREGRKKGGSAGEYDKNLVFNYIIDGFANHWNKILAKADGGRKPPYFSARDPSTKMRIHVYHVHTLRKMFRTSMGMAGVPDMVVHAWLGHKPYLNQYDKLTMKGMADIYKEHMDAVNVYEVSLDERTRAEIKEKIERADELAKQVIIDGAYIDMVGDQLDAFVGLGKEAKEALSVIEKWSLIIKKASQLKADAARSGEEIEKAFTQILNKKNE